MLSNYLLGHSLQMWVILILVVGSMFAYARNNISLELTSAIIFSFLLLFFYFFPVLDGHGNNKMNVGKILSGFANPALISVVSLLILGRAIIQTGAIYQIASIVAKISKNNSAISFGLVFIIVMAISAFLNNTPVVIIFIPIINSLAKKFNIPRSKVMMSLSYSSILGGLITLIGSSTNILVSGAIKEMGLDSLKFFDFSFPGVIMAIVGFVYIFFIAPMLLPDREDSRQNFTQEELLDSDREFISQVKITDNSSFIGQQAKDLFLEDFAPLSIKIIHRNEQAFIPPFDDNVILRVNDIIVLSSKRNGIKELMLKYPESLLLGTFDLDNGDGLESVEEVLKENLNMTEVIIPPSSELIDRSFNNIDFYKKYKCIVIGVQRQSHIIRSKLSSIKFATGDILLVIGSQYILDLSEETKDIALLSWSSENLKSSKEKIYAILILLFVILTSALEIIPISISSFIGATLAVVTRCIDGQAVKQSIDAKVVLIIVTSLALGSAMQETGGALFIADLLVSSVKGIPVIAILAILFVTMVIITNILSNNASAVLFTPIAVEVATNLGVDPRVFIYAVVFACNCSFVTPIGYQTNLLVMGPGGYQFNDYIKVGFPLSVLMLITYLIFSISYFDI